MSPNSETESLKDPAYLFNAGRVLFDCKDRKKVAVNLDGQAFSFVPALTPAYFLLLSNHDGAKHRQ